MIENMERTSKAPLIKRYWWIFVFGIVVLAGLTYIFISNASARKAQEEKNKSKGETTNTASETTKIDCPKTITYSADGSTTTADYGSYQKVIDNDTVTQIHNTCPEVQYTSATASGNVSPQGSKSSTAKTSTSSSTSSDSGSSDSATDNTKSTSTAYSSLSMITPYLSDSDIERIPELFSTSADAPWGFTHNGIDFVPKANLTTFRAAADGIATYQIFHNDNGGKWQVSMQIDHNPWSIQYAWEPFTFSEADAQAQIGYISVPNGATVKAGDTLGRLLVVDSNGAHMHFGVNMPGSSVCPQQYFTSDAYNSIMNIVHAANPSENMCY